MAGGNNFDLEQYIQDKRMKIVETLMPNDQVTDLDNARVVLTALSDMSTTDVQNKRLNHDVKASSDRERVFEHLQAIEEACRGNPYRREGIVTIEGPPNVMEVIVEDFTGVNGEMITGDDTGTHEDFMNRIHGS